MNSHEEKSLLTSAMFESSDNFCLGDGCYWKIFFVRGVIGGFVNENLLPKSDNNNYNCFTFQRLQRYYELVFAYRGNWIIISVREIFIHKNLLVPFPLPTNLVTSVENIVRWALVTRAYHTCASGKRGKVSTPVRQGVADSCISEQIGSSSQRFKPLFTSFKENRSKVS